MNALRIDNAVGMVLSNFIAWCIIVTTATVLHQQGITNISTSADAARALEPLVQTFPNSGYIAKLIFSFGVIGLGLLAVPVLSGSASYAVAEVFNWKASLNYKFKRARGFYGVMIVATLIGLLINFIGIDPIKALVVTAVINGIIAVPLIFLIGKIASSEHIMGEYKSGLLSKVFVTLTFFVTGLSALAMIYAFFGGK
jgi:Mn2+/Fe2+ NRAMP family transporter